LRHQTPAIPTIVAPSDDHRSLKHFFLSDIAMKQSMSIPMQKESLLNHGQNGEYDNDVIVDWKALKGACFAMTI
jgi:hypothetical protein